MDTLTFPTPPPVVGGRPLRTSPVAADLVSFPYTTSAEIENEVLALRKRFPSWGARKLKARLERMNPTVNWPAASTAGQILSRAGLTNPKRKKRRATPSSQPFSMVTAPNQLVHGFRLDRGELN